MKRNLLTLQKILLAISDEESHELFNVIADGKSSIGVVGGGKMTRKQYYLRLSKLVKLDLVKKVGSNYMLTTFGKTVYEAKMTLAAAVKNYYDFNSKKIKAPDEQSKVENQNLLS